MSEQCIVNLTEQLSLSENANYTLLDKLDKYRLYHRISGNFNKLNNRIGFKKIVKEANYYKLNEQRRRDLIDSLIKTIYETYNIKDSYKFNITLESVLYGFKECGITLDHEYAMRCVTEFYTNNTDMDKNEMKNIIQEVNLYNENARTNVLVLFEENKKVINIAGRSVVQSTTVKTLCDAYNTVKDKSIENLKSLFTRIYARSLEECVNESSNVLTIITTAVTTVGATAINPVLGLLVAFTNCIISREANIKQTDIYLKQLKKEKDKVQSKIDKTRGNTEELEKLLDKLELSIEKVSDYRFSIQSDNENDKDVDDSYMEANMSPSAMMAYIMCIDEAVKNNDNESLQLLTSCMESMSILNEDGNLMNTVKLVKEKLKNSASKLSTKEKALCKQWYEQIQCGSFYRSYV